LVLYNLDFSPIVSFGKEMARKGGGDLVGGLFKDIRDGDCGKTWIEGLSLGGGHNV